jgi:GT2 family glycosyltransferase
MRSVDISIVMVNYNSGKYISESVASILNHITIAFEVLVWDNASTDDSVQLLEQKCGHDERVRVFRGDENLGFAKANNRACEHARGKILHFLNPDTLVNEELNQAYVEILNIQEPDWCRVTSITDENGNPEHTTYTLPLWRDYLAKLFNNKKVRRWHIGASIILPAKTFAKAGQWCEDYFMYTEDMHLCYNLHKIGVVPQQTAQSVIHIGKVSSGNTWSTYQRALRIEKSLKTFYIRQGKLWEYYTLRPVQLTFALFKKFKDFRPACKAFCTLFFKVRRLD